MENIVILLLHQQKKKKQNKSLWSERNRTTLSLYNAFMQISRLPCSHSSSFSYFYSIAERAGGNRERTGR